MATQPKPSAAPVSIPSTQPNPANIFEAINSFQLTHAIKGAIELDLFTAIAEGAYTASAIATKCNCAERGARILCDYLTINGLLHKRGDQYSTTIDTGTFLDKRSPAYMGGVIDFLLGPDALMRFGELTDAVRNGGAPHHGVDTTSAENPMWERFARSMVGLIGPIAQATARMIDLPTDRETKLLDIAASHGRFGFAVAERYPKAHIVALDWKNVLPITAENAAQFGFANRFSTIAGDAFSVDIGQNYDLILLPNILHHFSAARNTELLTKCQRALNPGGTVAIVEFVPNDDRVSPPMAAEFSLTMLVGTPEGDAYTYAEYRDMLHSSGFSEVEMHSLHPLPHSVVIGRK